MDEPTRNRWEENKKLLQRMSTLYDKIKPDFTKSIANDPEGPQKLARFQNIGRELIKTSVELA